MVDPEGAKGFENGNFERWAAAGRADLYCDDALHACARGRPFETVWPSGLRRWLQAPVRKGVGSNPTAVI